LLVLMLRKSTTHYWEKWFPQLCKKGRDIRFAVLIDPELYEKLNQDILKSLVLEPTGSKDKGVSFFLFPRVTEVL